VTDVFLLAVVASLDAGLVAAAVVLLGRPRPARKLLAYLAGAIGCSFAFGLVIVLVLHRSTLLRGPSPSTSALIEVVAGILLLIVAIAVWWGRAPQWRPRRRGHEDSERRTLSERAVGHDSLWLAWAAGALYSLPGAYYVAGMALLAKLDRPLLTDVLAIAGFNLIMFAAIELPLLGFLVAPERTRAVTGRLNAWMTRHKRTLVVTVAGVGGAYLFVSGLIDVP
jgi:hypothetical protein